MSTIIAIHWSEPEIQFVVSRHGQVQTVSSVAVPTGQDPAAIGRRLAEALAPYSPGKAQTIVALSRGALEWQSLSLPPCPAIELPDLVRLQADHDSGAGDEDVGFDFLPLAGDEQSPYQVLTVALAAGELTKIRQACRAADLALKRIVPLAVGWPSLTAQVAPSSDTDLHLFVTPFAREATLWATRAGRVTLLRQLQLAETDDPATLATAIRNELRRTLLALSQQTDQAAPTISLVGSEQAKLTTLAATLDSQFEVSVQALDFESSKALALPANADSLPSALPLTGLAIAEAHGQRPLVDLLHPRQRPTSNTSVRTYALAGAAAVLLALLLGWQGYSNLQAPLEKSAEDQAELTLLEEPLENLKKYEQRAGAIRDWNAETANVLVHLQKMSKSVRPAALDAEKFPVDQDIVFDKFVLDRRRLTIDALARSSQAVQPLEARLRSDGYGPQRGKSEPSKILKGYPWHFRSTIEITSASDSANNTASEPLVEEPQS